MKRLMSSSGAIDVAVRPEGADVGNKFSKGYAGDAGADTMGESRCDDSSLCRLIASACLFGGPRLRLGRSYVHGMSRAAQARHGGPASSHWIL
jgi:hypothetical protein